MPIDTEIFETEAVKVGIFRCTPDDALFNDSGRIRNFCFVFPRVAVLIQHESERAFVADPTVVTLYNRRQAYRRDRIHPDGDRSDWYAVSEAILRDAIRHHDPAAADAPEHPLRVSHAPCDAATYRVQRELFVEIARGDVVDPLRVEETVVGLLHAVLGNVYAGTGPRSTRRDLEIVHAAQTLIARYFTRALKVTDIAHSLGCSIYHLCRIFRRAVGTTMHDYREQLRLRTALEHLEQSSDLTRLGLDLGYCSHSHFTARFQAMFGTTPSAVRTRISHGHRA